MSMYLAVEEFKADVKGLKDVCFEAMGNESTIMDMDDKTLRLIQACMKLINSSCELMTEQTKLLENIEYEVKKVSKVLMVEK